MCHMAVGRDILDAPPPYVILSAAADGYKVEESFRCRITMLRRSFDSLRSLRMTT